MAMIRRGIFSLTNNLIKTTSRVGRNNVPLFSSFSTTIEKRELGEEANYFRRLERERADKDAAMKANLAEILSRADHDEHKRAILDVVGNK